MELVDGFTKICTANSLAEFFHSSGWGKLDGLKSLNVYRTLDRRSMLARMRELGSQFEYSPAENLLLEWTPDSKEDRVNVAEPKKRRVLAFAPARTIPGDLLRQNSDTASVPARQPLKLRFSLGLGSSRAGTDTLQ